MSNCMTSSLTFTLTERDLVNIMKKVESNKTAHRPNNGLLKQTKQISVEMFKVWLEGVEEMQEDDWVPNKQQWDTIRNKIESIRVVPDVPEPISVYGQVGVPQYPVGMRNVHQGSQQAPVQTFSPHPTEAVATRTGNTVFDDIPISTKGIDDIPQNFNRTSIMMDEGVGLPLTINASEPKSKHEQDAISGGFSQSGSTGSSESSFA